MKKLAFKASLLAVALGMMIPQVVLGDEESTVVEGPVTGALMPVEHGIAPPDEGYVDGGVYGYGVDSGVRNPEYTHQQYLLSRTAGHAEYTHRWNLYHANQSPWHGGYYNAAWGRPLSLVVPPTADNQVKWGWGVGATTMTPIYHQFGRGNPTTYPQESWRRFRPKPYWPTHTDQFGVYYVRGPW